MNTGNGLAPLAGVALLLALQARPTPAQQRITLTLGDAARFAAARNAGPEAARSRVDMAEARLRQRRADLLPSLAGALGLGERTFNSAGLGLALRDPATGSSLVDPDGQVLGPVRTWDYRATARQSLVDFASFARIRVGRAAVMAADADLANASQQAAAEAATVYVRALWADAQLSARQADSGLADELLGIARRQRESGMGTTLDVTRAEAQLAAARSRLIAARTERARAGLELHRVLGLPFEVNLTMADSLAGMPTMLSAPSEAEAQERALRMRADVRLVEARRDVGQGQIRVIRAERLPTLSFFADAGRTGSGMSRLLNTYSWGVQVSISLFDGLRREGQIAEQRAVSRELDVRRRDLVQQVVFESRIALLQLTSASEQLTASDTRLALAEQEMALARRRYEEGVAGNADVITALLELNEARTQVVDARAAVQSARVALARAQGVVTELP